MTQHPLLAEVFVALSLSSQRALLLTTTSLFPQFVMLSFMSLAWWFTS